MSIEVPCTLVIDATGTVVRVYEDGDLAVAQLGYLSHARREAAYSKPECTLRLDHGVIVRKVPT